MVNRSIIAQNITNLSDARYFAAWGIDYISFNVIPDSPYFLPEASIKEIKEWVEGPKCLLEANALEFSELADGHILSNIYQSLPLSKEVFYRINFEDILKGIIPSKYIVDIRPKDLSLAQNLDPQLIMGSTLYLNTNKLDISNYQAWPEWGLAVQGSEEEKVGLKSFDSLDELYDILMDEN